MNNGQNFGNVNTNQVNNTTNPVNQFSNPVNQPNNNQNNNYYIQQNVSNKKTSKKTIFIILAILVLAVIGIFVYFKFIKNDESTVDLKAIFDPNKPIIIESNDKYGYITSEGKMMIEPKYNSAGEFNGNYAVVKIDNPNEDSYYDEIYQVIDKKGNVKATSESYIGPKYYSEYGIWVINGILYDSKFNKITTEGIEVDYKGSGYLTFKNAVTNKSGIMNYKGREVFSWIGTSISADLCTNANDEGELYVAIRSYSTDKAAIINLKNGKILYNFENANESKPSCDGNGIFKVYNSDYDVIKWLYFNNGKLVYETDEEIYDIDLYDYENKILEIDYGYDYEELGKGQRYFYYHIKNKKLSTDKPSAKEENEIELDLIELTYGYRTYSVSGKYGIASGDKVVISSEYDDIDFLNSNLYNYMLKSKGKELALFEKNDNTLLMNVKNKEVVATFDSDYVYDYDDSTFLKVKIYNEDNTTQYVVYNLLTNKSMTFDGETDLSIYSNYITIEKDNVTTYYNTKLKEVYSTNK